MRTLLTDLFPPQYRNQQTVPGGAEGSAKPAARKARIFPQTAVLLSVDDLVEVGVDGTVIATPGALAAK
jgi:hypothetical protein